ncbi:hypothetical protein Maq22A_c28715 [Methylobacterium aquaticum]|uniref:Uncharacterized protein n=1 Tax=Methylobacterium aquaticum TaxID=270351 RepID=A0A1Y0Z8U3_9HYPH|nr:hypothetical protein Maq22A_c28715 [Methylobacterium aquaticum]
MKGAGEGPDRTGATQAMNWGAAHRPADRASWPLT